MQVTLLKSKIHRAAVTGASLHYEGSLTVSADIAKMVGLLPYEKILVGNLQNGERFETYVIYGPAEMGLIELNGATAHLGAIGDRLRKNLGGAQQDQDDRNHPGGDVDVFHFGFYTSEFTAWISAFI